jgi:hypothetical protein
MTHSLTLDSQLAKLLRQMSLLEKAKAVFLQMGLEFAIVGGQAYSAQGGVGSTFDFDVIVMSDLGLCHEIVKTLAIVQVVLFEPIDSFGSQSPKAKFIDFGSREVLDIIFSTSPFENSLIERADMRLVSGVVVPVLAIADLILLDAAVRKGDYHAKICSLGDAYPRGYVLGMLESRMELGGPALSRLGKAARRILIEEQLVAPISLDDEGI